MKILHRRVQIRFSLRFSCPIKNSLSNEHRVSAKPVFSFDKRKIKPLMNEFEVAHASGLLGSFVSATGINLV